MKIGFASADWAMGARGADGRPSWGGSGWARCGLPARHLAAIGFDVAEGTLVWSKEAGVFLVRQWPTEGQAEDDPALYVLPDLIVLQRWMFASVAAETPTAIANGQVVVNDVDDHFWALDQRNRAYASTDPTTNPIENRDLYLAAVKASSAVTVSTPFLADELRRLGVKCPIHVLENHVDLSVYEDTWTANLGRTSRVVAGEVSGRWAASVGWVGATPWRSGDLEILQGILGPFIERHDLLAYHGGHLEAAESFAAQTGVEERRMMTKPMVPIHDYPNLFRGLDVGLVPLRDVPFNRAKSCIKGIEYAAAGVPFVASALPEYRRLLARHGIGRVATRAKDWNRHLGRLLNPEARLEEIVSNRTAVKALDIHQGIVQWRDLYLDLLVNA